MNSGNGVVCVLLILIGLIGAIGGYSDCLSLFVFGVFTSILLAWTGGWNVTNKRQ